MLGTVREVVAIGLDNTCSVYEISRSLPTDTLADPSKNFDRLPGRISKRNTRENPFSTYSVPDISIPAAAARNDLISILFRQSIATVSEKDIQQCCTFLPPDPLARTKEESNITAKNARLVTGGSDGVVRMWTVCYFFFRLNKIFLTDPLFKSL